MKASVWSKKILILAIIFGIIQSASAQVVSVVAGLGGGNPSADGEYVLNAKFAKINGILADNGGALYITTGHAVRIADAYGILNTVAGYGNSGGKTGDGGPATAAKVNGPTGMALGKDGSLYFCDTRNSCVRKIDKDGIITTVAGFGGPGFTDDTLAIHARLNGPTAVAVDDTGNIIIFDKGNFRLRKVNTSGRISTIRENVYFVDALVPLSNGDLVYADGYYNVIVKLTPAGVLDTIAGTGAMASSGDNGPAKAAALAAPKGMCIDSRGNIYVGEYFTGKLRMITPDGIINTVAGAGTKSTGPASETYLGSITCIAADARDNIYVVDAGYNIIRCYYPNTDKDGGVGDMLIFPNPCQSFTNVILPSGTAEIATVYALDMSGRVVCKSQGPTNGYISLKFEDAGTYMLLGVTRSSKWTGKVAVITP